MTGTGTTTDATDGRMAGTSGITRTVSVHPGFSRIIADWQALSTSWRRFGG